MTTMEKAIQALSPEARSAIMAARSSKQGERVPRTGVAPATFVELVEWGLIGPNDGLTRQGSLVRTKLVNDAIDAI
jgi:hypothetical protein